MSASALSLLVLCSCLTASAQSRCAIPPFLHPGDSVAVVAPSFVVKDPEVMDRAIAVIREWGFVPVQGRNAVQRFPEYKNARVDHYGGTPQERAEELRWAFENPSIKAVVCARGGYGTLHLLDHIPAEYYAGNPKWLVGYSDATTLLAGENIGGLAGIHGNMCSAIGGTKGPDDSSLALRDLLLGSVPSYTIPAHSCNRTGHAEGMLVGGNLMTLVSLLDTQYDVTALDGTILFIEEVEETYHAIDRMIHMLMFRDRLPHFKGIILGQFTRCGKDLPFTSVAELFSQYTAGLGIPVCNGFPGGHGKVNMPLIMGADVILDVTDTGSTIRFNIK